MLLACYGVVWIVCVSSLLAKALFHSSFKQLFLFHSSVQMLKNASHVPDFIRGTYFCSWYLILYVVPNFVRGT